MSAMPQAKALTVQELHARLSSVVDKGHGHLSLVIPYDPGRDSIGGTPATGVIGLHPGIDWDAGKVFLQPEHPLGVAGADLERVRKTQRDATKALFFIKRVIGDAAASETEKLERIRTYLGLFNDATLKFAAKRRQP